MSSLSQQLKTISDKTASVAVDRKSRSKIHSRSLIFDPKVAAAQDYDYLYELGVEGLEEIIDIDSRFSKFRSTLFSETAINLDRNVQTKETLEQLDRNVSAFLDLIGPYLLLSPAVKALEWLVRRFYINYHSSELLLLAALPYHNQPVFVKVLNVIPRSVFPSIFGWVLGYKEILKPVPSSSILKAFHNDFEIFKLYTLYLIEHIQNRTIYKEQLVFYLTITVQLLASLSKKVEVLNETFMPVLLEVVGTMLLPSTSKIQSDIKLTSYSIIAVLGSIVPLSRELIASLTESILQDPKAIEQATVRSTLIVLGQLWNFYENTKGKLDTNAIATSFKNLPQSVLTTESIASLNAENYKLNKFLTYYFLATYPESKETFNHIVINSLNFKLIFNKVLESSTSGEERVRLLTIKISEALLENDRKLFIESLQESNLKIDDLEMRLMTTLGSGQFEDPEDLVFDAGEEDNLEDDSESPIQELAPSKVDSFFSNSDEEFATLIRSLLSTSTDKLAKFVKFSEQVFGASTDKSTSFFLRVAYTPSIPLAVRITALKFSLLQIKSTSQSDIVLDIYLLIPILLLGLYDQAKSIRLGTIEILKFIKEQTTLIHKGKKKVKSSLFMENQIYVSTEASKRAIISPHDAVALSELLFHDDIISDTLIDSTRLIHILFQVVFTQKKVGLIYKTFILNQWSLSFWPITLKAKIWEIISKVNLNGSEDRFFFTQDLALYFSKRTDWMQQASAAKIDFLDIIERSVVGMVGGSATESSTEVDWILQGLENPSGNLQIRISERLIKIFSSFNVEFKVKIVNKLVELLTNDTLIDFDPMDTLQSLDFDLDLFISALSSVQLSSEVPEQALAKRRRRSSNSTKQAMARDDINNMASVHLKKLTIVLDVLETKLRSAEITISRPNLLQALFRILTDLDYLGNDGNLPVLYAQETLASCMLLSIIQMKASKETFNFDSNSVRADLIVNSIRSAQSPQVQNRLLLVIAELASLVPEIILHSVMPIFTFMGAHTVRQDDEFSSSALQQTIAKVIPALALNGSSSLTSEIEFLLTSFVTAFQHIPRHRRVKLFTSLTKTLGYEKSLPSLLFLMSQQYVNNYTKNKIAECDNLAEFTNSFLKSFPASEQLVGIKGFSELWDQIPIVQVEPNSDEYAKLNSRSIFGGAILGLTTEGLTSLKAQSLRFISDVLAKDKSNYSSVSSMKIKIALVLLDPEAEEQDKQDVLSGFRNMTSFILSGLDTFSNVTYNKEIAASLYELLSNFLNLLPLNYFVDSIIDSLDVEKLSDSLSIKVSRNFAILAGQKFETELNASNIEESLLEEVLGRFLEILIGGIKKNIDVELQQAYLDTYSIIINKFGQTVFTQPENSKVLSESLSVFTAENGLLNEQPEIIISSINTIASVVNILGVKVIGFFPKIVPPALKIWEITKTSEDEESAKLLQASILVLLSCLVKKIPAFMASNLDSILITILTSDLIESDIRSNVLSLLVEHMDLSQVLKSLCNVWGKKEFYKNDDAGNLGLFLNTLELTIEKIDKKAATGQSTVFIKWLIQSFEFRHYSETQDNKFDNNTIHRLESSFYTCGITYVMKLNDKNFRPLFANLVRWAVYGEGSNLDYNTEISRLLAFFRFFNKLQEKLKSIITSYYSYLSDPVASLLVRFASGDVTDINLRRIVLISLTSSFKYDQDDYWSQQGRFESVCLPLLSQLGNIEAGIGKYLVKAITSFVSNVSSDEYNETLVNGLIKYITNEGEGNTPNTKTWTIRTLKTIFQKMGEQWLSYLPTLIPYIAELLEDDDEEVELEVRTGLVRVIESVLGEPLDRYLN